MIKILLTLFINIYLFARQCYNSSIVLFREGSSQILVKDMEADHCRSMTLGSSYSVESKSSANFLKINNMDISNYSSKINSFLLGLRFDDVEYDLIHSDIFLNSTTNNTNFNYQEIGLNLTYFFNFEYTPFEPLIVYQVDYVSFTNNSTIFDGLENYIGAGFKLQYLGFVLEYRHMRSVQKAKYLNRGIYYTNYILNNNLLLKYRVSFN